MVGTVGERLAGGSKDFVVVEATDELVRTGKPLAHGEVDLAARRMVDRGFTTRYDYALQTLREVPYNKWREYDPEDTIRFYALRLREAGMIKSTPGKIIANGTDWRFVNELKRELKG